MTTKKFLGVVLSLVMAVPSSARTVTATTGTVKGIVSMAGRGLEGLSITLVSVETGKSFAVRSASGGSFTATVPAGSYVFSSPGRSGVSIARAPLSVDVVSGRVASANVEVSSFSVQDPAVQAGTAKITHEGSDCITEGEFTLIEAIFEPLASVVNGRLYFQSNLSPEWFYTEFEKIEPVLANGFTHRAFIPKVNQDGGIETINYYIQVTSSDFAETKSPERTVKVVSGATECVIGAAGAPGGLNPGTLAPVGTPAGAVSVLSASGSVAGSLAGFGGVAGAALGGIALAGIGTAVVVGGVVVQQVAQTGATPTPVPTVAPTATPVPTPTPGPTADPICTLTVFVAPDIAADPFFGGRFCQANVSSSVGIGGIVNGQGVFGIPCTARVEISAFAQNQSSLAGPLPAVFSGACNQSALGNPCILNPLRITQNLSLNCQLR